jgi:hypothetical protein
MVGMLVLVSRAVAGMAARATGAAIMASSSADAEMSAIRFFM